MEELENLNEELITLKNKAEDDIGSPEDVSSENEDIPNVETAENSQSNEAEMLRQELSELQAYVEDKRSKEEKALCELEEFERLYPDVSIDSIDEEVWERVRSGLPLSAAYALREREKELQMNFAEQVNLRNSAAAAGSAGSPPCSDYFSPDEVKAMSGKEVRQNYANIRKSMNYWRKTIK